MTEVGEVGVRAVGRVTAMAHPSAPELLVLHALRLKGFAETDVVAGATGVDEAAVAASAQALVGAGLVQRRDGKVSGWSLTKDGRADHAARVAAEVDASGQRDVVDAAYRAFLAANGDMLATCTAWQLRDEGATQVINDHSDPQWDAAVLDRLAELDRRVQPVLDLLDGSLDRFAGYRDRFATALARVRAGELEWFTKPVIDSYHTVWFELHEDLLCTLGIERASEAQHAS